MGPVTKKCPTSVVPQALFILYVFLERTRRRGSPASLSSPLVSKVSPNRGRARDALCSTCSSQLKTSSNPVINKSAYTMWTKRRIMRMRRKLCFTTKHEGKKTLCAGEKAILIRHNRLKNLLPLLSTHRKTQTHQLVTCRIDGRNSEIRGKVV